MGGSEHIASVEVAWDISEWHPADEDRSLLHLVCTKLLASCFELGSVSDEEQPRSRQLSLNGAKGARKNRSAMPGTECPHEANHEVRLFKVESPTNGTPSSVGEALGGNPVRVDDDPPPIDPPQDEIIPTDVGNNEDP